jgi:hypothetical protein
MDWIMLVLIAALFVIAIVFAVLVELRCRRIIRTPKSQCPRYTYTKETPRYTYTKETHWEIPKKDGQ